MTHRSLLTIVLRIAGIFLFTKIFDHFGSHIFSIWSISAMDILDKTVEAMDRFYFSNLFLLVVNILVSFILIIKAEWIAKKLVKTEESISIDLNVKSLTKVILLTTSIIWIARAVYFLPQAIRYCIAVYEKTMDMPNAVFYDFEMATYIFKLALAIIFFLRIDKITNWITKKI
ncbi:hypothetical protein [Nonlabens ulvanivorans]|uniref:hypothetical protein n=3 Tax=Nonlabens ulvanivorans TaxID=906888 RepID=UPI0005A72145|nr:hypothetical protein [Nonlabens ulvanivorans]|tara:strand:+ start:217 stop:735 length:519 start_codon:yes stop_codon:yes gene_type:complete